MVNRTLVSTKLAELNERLERIRSHCPPEAEQLASDPDALDIVSFNLMLAVQSCIDVASHIIADEGWSPANGLAEAFTRLEQHGVISAELAVKMRKAAGFRNVVAHGYAGVDRAAVHGAGTQGVLDLAEFARALVLWANAG